MDQSIADIFRETTAERRLNQLFVYTSMMQSQTVDFFTMKFMILVKAQVIAFAETFRNNSLFDLKIVNSMSDITLKIYHYAETNRKLTDRRRSAKTVA